jgi:hypothetical protein
MASRPAQGNNSKPTKPGRPRLAPKFPSALKRVSIGSVSRPKALPKWAPKAQPAPRKVSNPRTIA